MERMSHLVKAIAALAGHRAPKLMPVDSFDFFGMTLSDDCSLGAWLRDPAVERDQRVFLRIISTKMTFDRDVFGFSCPTFACRVVRPVAWGFPIYWVP